MTDRRRHAAPMALAIAAAIALAACTGSIAAPSAATRATALASGPPAPAVGLTQAWATAPLVDVATGQTFHIADHAGKVIIIETMAIWCTNCRAQQRDVQAALARLPAGQVVYIVLDVDPSEDGASLAAYRTKNGFQGRYTVAGNAAARAFAADFGDQFLNPPSTPMLVVGSDGTVTRTSSGHKSVEDIVALAKAHGA